MFKFLKSRKMLTQLESFTCSAIKFTTPNLDTISKRDFKLFKRDLKTITKYMKPYIIHKTLFPCVFEYSGYKSEQFLTPPLKAEDFKYLDEPGKAYTKFYHLASLGVTVDHSKILNNELRVVKCVSLIGYYSAHVLDEGLYRYIANETKWSDGAGGNIFPEEACEHCSNHGDFFIDASSRKSINFRCSSCGGDTDYLLNKKERKQLIKDFTNYSLKVK